MPRKHNDRACGDGALALWAGRHALPLARQTACWSTVLCTQVPQESQDRAMKYRCKTLLNKAADLDEMKDIANSPMCAAAF